MVVGTGGALAPGRELLDWINQKQAHCDAVEKEYLECKDRAAGAAPRGFWYSPTGVGIKVGGVTLIVGAGFVGGVAGGLKLEHWVETGKW